LWLAKKGVKMQLNGEKKGLVHYTELSDSWISMPMENVLERGLEGKVFHVGRVIGEEEGIMKVSLRGSVVDGDGWKAIESAGVKEFNKKFGEE